MFYRFHAFPRGSDQMSTSVCIQWGYLLHNMWKRGTITACSIFKSYHDTSSTLIYWERRFGTKWFRIGSVESGRFLSNRPDSWWVYRIRWKKYKTSHGSIHVIRWIIIWISQKWTKNDSNAITIQQEIIGKSQGSSIFSWSPNFQIWRGISPCYNSIFSSQPWLDSRNELLIWDRGPTSAQLKGAAFNEKIRWTQNNPRSIPSKVFWMVVSNLFLDFLSTSFVSFFHFDEQIFQMGWNRNHQL